MILRLTLEMRDLEERLLDEDLELTLERLRLERELDAREEDDEDFELTLELLELEEDLVLFFRPGTNIFLSFRRTVLSSWISSSSLMLITLIIFSAALSPI